MNKEDILKMNREENNGKLDEREMMAIGKASRIGMLVGGFVCIALVLVGELVLNMPELSLVCWLVYFSMLGSTNIVLYKYLKKTIRLAYGIFEITFAVAFAVCIVIKNMG